MSSIKVGDIVARKSYGYDILFRVIDVQETARGTYAVLHGLHYRLEADSPEADLVVQPERNIHEHDSKFDQKIERCMRNSRLGSRALAGSSGGVRSLKKAYSRGTANDYGERFFISPRILHIDGDNEYMESCIEQYKKLNLDITGRYVPEREQPQKIRRILEEVQPSILVMTGHDAMIKGDKAYLNVDNYRNSKYYIQSVTEARKFQPSHQKLVIFAGACQSYFRGLIDAGADFASAPYRVNIHMLDPVFVCQKVANAYFYEVLSVPTAISNTITGYKGIGGIQTFGMLNEGYPKEPYKS